MNSPVGVGMHVDKLYEVQRFLVNFYDWLMYPEYCRPTTSIFRPLHFVCSIPVLYLLSSGPQSVLHFHPSTFKTPSRLKEVSSINVD